MAVTRFLVLCALVACSDDRVIGPFDRLPQDGEFVVGLEAPVQVARDKYGVAHITGTNVRDVGFVQGYVMAHDRLPQMDILRRFGAGTLGELFGQADMTVIDTDLEMRMHRMKPLAQQTFDILAASSDPVDRDLVDLLQRFSDGVNAYYTDLSANKWTLDPDVEASFPPGTFVAWTPIDSLVLGRFQAFALSWSTPFELDLDELYTRLRASYDTAAAPPGSARDLRRGISRDLLTFTPVGTMPTIDGFPNSPTDGGSRSDGSDRKQAAGRPAVSQATYDSARAFFRRGIHTGPHGGLGPHAFMRPYAGSNNWAVGPARAADGAALLATDQHLQLPNPSIFYPTHLIIRDAREPANNLDVLGITFPGIPGVILGSNGKVAWSATVAEHDVNDIYRETLCPTGDCVVFNGAEVAIETFDEEIIVGAFGFETDRIQAKYERVPHHGPIIPKIDPVTHRLVPRVLGDEVLSVKYTGHVPTFEFRALWNLAHAKSVDEGFDALADFTYGSQNWTMIDSQQNIAWTTNAFVPDRSAASYTWNAVTRPDGDAPFFILDGTGGFEWDALPVSPRYVPHATNPPQGYLATANADPVGSTFDGDPLNQLTAEGKPLYVGVSYAAGVRQERIAQLIEDAFVTLTPITLDFMARMQHDTRSNVGAKLRQPIVSALALLEAPPAMPGDLQAFVAGLDAADRARIVTARTLLAGWSFATPTSIDRGVPASPDSAATVLFNAWMHYFLERTLKDELENARPSPTTPGFDLHRLDGNQLVRIVFAMLTNPGTFVQDPSTMQPILCDDFTSTSSDSCTTMIMRATLDAVKFLESPAGFADASPSEWRWGAKHQLKIETLFPTPVLSLPAPGELTMDGFARAGDNFAVNRADHGYADLDFSQFADGPAQRFLAIAAPDQPIAVKWQLPGGVIFDSRSPHYRDLLDNYYLPEVHFDAPFSVDQIVESGEHRWDFR